MDNWENRGEVESEHPLDDSGTLRPTLTPSPFDPDVQRFIAHFAALALAPSTSGRGWDHMGALLSDAALQPRARYAKVVEPRVRALLATWPEASTTSVFSECLTRGTIGTVLSWNGTYKLRVLKDLTTAMSDLDVETVGDLYLRYTNPELAPTMRSRLRAIVGVGPKTVDYISILAGVREHAAIDLHLRRFAENAGIKNRTYDYLSRVIRAAAFELGCNPGDLDKPIWAYMSSS